MNGVRQSHRAMNRNPRHLELQDNPASYRRDTKKIRTAVVDKNVVLGQKTTLNVVGLTYLGRL